MPSSLTEEHLETDALLNSGGVFYFFGLTRQALYEARQAGRLVPDKKTGRGFLYMVSTIRAYRDSIDPRGRAASPMHSSKP